MTRTLLMFAAVSGLAMSSALAQAPPAPAPTLAPPPAAASSNPGSVPIVNAQAKDEWLASKLKGMTVVGSDDQKIGSVVDILFDKTGQVRAFIVGVGGLLGLGAKQVAVEMTAFREVPAADGNSDQLKLASTKDQMADAAEFKPFPEPATTTGAAPSGSRPAGSPARQQRQ
jgi:sporulation protein YlmC with PRC-barrel domain